jgi:hypothetical protein
MNRGNARLRLSFELGMEIARDQTFLRASPSETYLAAGHGPGEASGSSFRQIVSILKPIANGILVNVGGACG